MGSRQKPRIPIGSPNVSQFIKKSSFPSFFVSVFFSSLVGIWLFCYIRISLRYLCQPRVLRLYLDFGANWLTVHHFRKNMKLCMTCKTFVLLVYHDFILLQFLLQFQPVAFVDHPQKCEFVFLCRRSFIYFMLKIWGLSSAKRKSLICQEILCVRKFLYKIFSNTGDAILSSLFKDSVKTVVVLHCFLSFAFIYCLHLSCMD